MKNTSPYSIVKWIFLLLILSQFIECKRSGDGCPDKIIDSTHFDSSELAKIPDWLGDSLFFYSDAGDTAYMVCNVQYFHYTDGDFNGANPSADCGRTSFYYYPEYYYGYTSNHKDLDNIRVIIFKESNLNPWEPGPPLSRIFLSPKLDEQKLSNIGGTLAYTDSITLLDGYVEKGWLFFSLENSFNLKVGILRLKVKSTKWTLYKYVLNN